MKKSYFLTLITFVIFLSSCSTTYLAFYDISLTNTEKSALINDNTDNKTVINDVRNNIFEDEEIKIVWNPSPIHFSFTLSNKTGNTIKIIWDEAALVDQNGFSHRVIHSGVKYTDRNNQQQPSIVIRKGTIQDFVFPSDNIEYVEGQYGGWREIPLFPASLVKVSELSTLFVLASTNVVIGSPQSPTEFELEVRNHIGKNLQILLPLEINGVINEYIFGFHINNAGVKNG